MCFLNQAYILIIFVGMLTTSTLLWIGFPELQKNQDVNNTVLEDFTKFVDAMQNTTEMIKSYRSRRMSLLQNNIKDSYSNSEEKEPANDAPLLQYETLRRDIKSNVRDIWILIKYAVNHISQLLIGVANHDMRRRLLDMLKLAEQQKQWLLSDIERLTDFDGYDTWRIEESKNLSSIIQGRLHYLQHPKNCSAVKKLICILPQETNFAAQVHNIAYCLIIAYATNRTLIIDKSDRISHAAMWEHSFLPLSSTCRDWKQETQTDWPDEAQVVYVRNVTKLLENPPFPPLSIPKDLGTRMERLHGDPSAWWIGQLVKYILRVTPQTQNDIKELRNKIDKENFVGLHIEVSKNQTNYYFIVESMSHAEDYYSQLEMTKPMKRNIFLSTNDLNVLHMIQNSYLYNIFGSRFTNINNTRQDVAVENSITQLILDIFLLANSNYLICSFNSDVCRLAYEIMQTLHVDASNQFISIDSRYFFNGQKFLYGKAVIGHEPKSPDQLLMVQGDIIRVNEYTNNGFSNGKNLRTLQSGVVPNFKIKNLVKVQNYPEYDEVH